MGALLTLNVRIKPGKEKQELQLAPDASVEETKAMIEYVTGIPEAQ